MERLTAGRTLPFDSALKVAGPRAFNLMIKPAGSLCNLGCSYCYYLDKAEIYGGREPRMDEDSLERVTRRYIEACEIPQVSFVWHGGEPVLAGMDFFRKALEFQKKYAGKKKILNCLQTNGTLLTEEWGRFLKDNGFLVGISVDGPRDVHDRFRKAKGGGGSFDSAMKGIGILRDAGVDYNIMATISSAGEGRGREIYRFLKSLGSDYIQFSPIVEHITYPDGRKGRDARPVIVPPSFRGATIAPWSVSAAGFGRFLCDVFDEWAAGDIGRVFVNYFDATLSNWCGTTPGLCSFAPTCGGNAIVEHNGDIYPCDHFVYKDTKAGNIISEDLAQIMDSESVFRFGQDKRDTLPKKCRECEYLRLCNGGCPKHRFSGTDRGPYRLNALCEGYYRFFRHSAPLMKEMRDYLSTQMGEVQAH